MSASVFPAYVGMSPDGTVLLGCLSRVPRIRGDEPWGYPQKLERLACSPHTWG